MSYIFIEVIRAANVQPPPQPPPYEGGGRGVVVNKLSKLFRTRS
jgi:hypothetical protein